MKKQLISRNKFAAACGLAMLTAMPSIANAQANQFLFSKSRARLVVLLHGVTPKPEESPEQNIGFSGHARHYWGFEFIKGLQGRTDETAMRVITPRLGGNMGMRPNTTHGDWQANTTDTNPFDYAPICFPVSWNTSLPAGIETNQTLIKDYIRLMTKSAGANTTMVMVNTRDGSKHLMPQLGQTIDEVYQSYHIAFGSLPIDQQPQIYLLGHSFGGIIARGILANPTQGDLWGNKLTANQRERCNYLRQRVVLVQTLAAPHEGTPIGDSAGDIADYINANGYNIILGLFNTLSFPFYHGKTPSEVKAWAKEKIKFALDAVSGKRDCLQDLLRIKEYNSGILNPSTAQRFDGSSLVPIYTAAGRNPGGKYYDQSRSVFLLGGMQNNPVSTFDLLGGTRGAKESSALMLIEKVLHEDGYGARGKMPWGLAENPAGDRVSSPAAGVGPLMARGLEAGWVPSAPTITGVVGSLLHGAPYKFGVGDGEWDNDGFLAWDSAHAFHINAPNYFRIYDQNRYGGMLPWDDDNHGSIMFNEANGSWIHNEVIREAGPYVLQPGQQRSVWNATDYPQTPNNGIKVEVLELRDANNDLDPATQADFTLKMRVGASEGTTILPDNMGVVGSTRIPAFTLTNFASPIIPIKITVIERDTADIVPSPDDLCVVGPVPGHTSMYFYFDTRTNRILGDIHGEAGQIIETNPVWWGVVNRVKTKIRVTRI